MNFFHKTLLLIFAVLLLTGQAVFCQNEQIRFSYNGSGSYYLVERSDLRRYDNGKYTGLVTREVRSFIARTASPANANPLDSYYDGSFFVSQDTRRASDVVGSGIHDSIPSVFKIDADGKLFMIEDNGYPTFRSFPAFTSGKITQGQKWVARAERAIDPLNKGIVTKIPMEVEYTYLKNDVFHGEEVYVLSVQWATRYGISYWDFGGDKELKSAQGSHKANMYVSKKTGTAVLVQDKVDETFIYHNGQQVAYKGTITLFTEYPPAVDRDKIIPILQRVALITDDEAKDLMNEIDGGDNTSEGDTGGGNSSSIGGGTTTGGNNFGTGDFPSVASILGSGSPTAKNRGTGNGESNERKNDGGTSSENGIGNNEFGDRGESNNKSGGIGGSGNRNGGDKSSSSEKNKKDADKPVTVENTNSGIRLTMRKLQFKADSAELLTGENTTLDLIATVLKQIPQTQFLVEGHTASTGNPNGEQRLSEQRAHTIAVELAKRGVAADKFICKGSGGRKPIADNSTSEGKAKNRRVEITILE